MKYCNKCGTQVSDDKRFCPNCRAYLPEKPNRMPDEAPVEKPVETPAEKPVEKPKQIARVWFRCPKCGAEFERARRLTCRRKPPASVLTSRVTIRSTNRLR